MNQITREQFGCESIDLDDGRRIDVHMANNAGRGDDNVTLTLVRDTTERPQYTRWYVPEDVIAQTRTSGWRGRWALSARVRQELGLALATEAR